MTEISLAYDAISERVAWESAMYWYHSDLRRQRVTQYQTGPRHGQQLADARKAGKP